MIPPQVALIVWILVSVGMFAVLKPLRAFLLTYVIGYLVLPCEVGNPLGYVGSIVISQSLRLDKLTVCNIGALLGTIIFSSHVFARLRLHWVDGAFTFVVVGIFLTSMVNGLGGKDGVSHGVEEVRRYLPLMILARVYLRDVGDLYEALRCVVGAAFLYAFICMIEWRLSPILHRLAYGYFQHSFDQFARYDHFRPVGFLQHAIELSFFMGTSTAAAGWLWTRGLLKDLWGFIPGWAVVGWIGVGLMFTLTFSGYGAFLLTAGVLTLIAYTRSRWMLLILPIFAIIWMVGRYSNEIDASLLMRSAKMIDPSRSESLQYRLDSERMHLAAASQSPILGRGAWNGTNTDTTDFGPGKAVDGWWLITMVCYGLVGITGWYLVWGAGIVDLIWRWSTLTRDLQALGALVAVMLGAQFVDFLFNAFPSPLLMLLNMGAISTLQAWRTVRRREMQEIPAWPLVQEGPMVEPV